MNIDKIISQLQYLIENKEEQFCMSKQEVLRILKDQIRISRPKFKVVILDYPPDYIMNTMVVAGMSKQDILQLRNQTGGVTAPVEDIIANKIKTAKEDTIWFFSEVLRELPINFPQEIPNDPMVLEKIIRITVRHECRHAEQYLCLRKYGYDVLESIDLEGKAQKYGAGPAESDAIENQCSDVQEPISEFLNKYREAFTRFRSGK